jgi:hypothetical protein
MAHPPRRTRIIQIIPAIGWVCEYSQGDKPNEVSHAACFALHEDGEIVLMDLCSDGEISAADETSNFVKCEYRGEQVEAFVLGTVDTNP